MSCVSLAHEAPGFVRPDEHAPERFAIRLSALNMRVVPEAQCNLSALTAVRVCIQLNQIDKHTARRRAQPVKPASAPIEDEETPADGTETEAEEQTQE